MVNSKDKIYFQTGYIVKIKDRDTTKQNKISLNEHNFLPGREEKFKSLFFLETSAT